MVSPPEIKMTDEGEIIATLESPIDCPWRTVDPKQKIFECHMPNGPAGKRGCPEYDAFPAGCPMIEGVMIAFRTKN